MNEAVNTSWAQTNQRVVMAALAGVRALLEAHIATATGREYTRDDAALRTALTDAQNAMPAPSALDVLSERFDLSNFERSVLLLCAGIELDGSFATLCAAAQGDASRLYPTFGLALAVFADAEWHALSPAAPLRYWRLIDVGAGAALTSSPLRIDERILHYLAGVNQMDDRLAGMIEPVAAEVELVPSQTELVDRVVEAWTRSAKSNVWPVVQLYGDDAASRRTIAFDAAAKMGLGLAVLSVHAVPTVPSEVDALIRLWERESLLSGNALLLDYDDADTTDATRLASFTRCAEQARSMVLVIGRERLKTLRRAAITFEVRRPDTQEQHALWHRALGLEAEMQEGEIDRVISQFRLSAAAIQSIGAQSASPDALWDACRAQARPRLSELAQHIDAVAGWSDLVVPESQGRTLREIAAHVRQRATVYEKWGFAAKSSRGLGISALFTGPSGTGKTMAAEVLASELRLDLYRIDLSQVVSKYIGETEKNLRRVFDAAEEGGAILLFDEADALFGKRSEVKDSHDRYANIEVSYLLQRMESYRGLAILTTNMKGALDTAFLRRIRFIVEFPFPDAAIRAAIWQRVFPATTPIMKLDYALLARLNVTGGNIANIALGAAFLAAEAGEPVTMLHLLRAAQVEYAKLERPLTGSETAGWV